MLLSVHKEQGMIEIISFQWFFGYTGETFSKETYP